jgi:polar amino acid transport system substrate-binding protein
MPLLIAVLLLGLLPSLAAAAAVDWQPQQDQPMGQPTEIPDDWSRIQDAGTIVFGTAADYPPFEFYNSRFELDGFDIALASALGEQLGLEVQFKDYAFDGVLNAVQLGEVDAAIAAVSVAPDRQQVVDFTNLYYVGNSVAMASDAFTQTIRAATDFAGLTVGVQRGTTFQARAQEMLVDSGVIRQEDLLVYPNVSAAIVDVRSGALDVALMGEMTAQEAMKNADDLILIGEGFYQQQYAIAVPKESNLTTQLNQALVALQSDGTFAELVKLYLREDPEHVTPGEDAAIVENAPVTETVEATGPALSELPCVDGMSFVGDLNLDDQNMTAPPVMAPGQDFSKGWRMRNSGTCTWAADYAIAYVNGNRPEAQMNGVPTAVGRTVAPGETVDIWVALRAPQVYGTFQGFWQLRNSFQQYFGQVVWVGIQVPDPSPPPPPPPSPASKPTPNLRADSNYINQGQCTTIRWDIDGVMAVFFIENGVESGVGGHDSRNVCPPQTTTYVLRVMYMDGSTTDYPITINVNPTGDYTVNFWADDTNIDAGQCTTLRWDVRNVQAVYLNGEGVPGVSQRDVCPTQTTTYTLVATKMDGTQDSRQVTIQVWNAQPPENEWPIIEQFTVTANQIGTGQCVTFEWRTDNADAINLLRNGTPIVAGGATNGSAQDCPPAAGLYEYRLDAYSGAGQVSQVVMVSVSTPQVQPR